MGVIYKALAVYIAFWVILIASAGGMLVCGILVVIKKKKGEEYRKQYNLMWKFSIPLFFIIAGFLMTFF